MDKYGALKEFGLDEREANIYVVMLGLGPASASMIAKRTGILRPTAYDVLDVMSRKGVVAQVDAGGKKLFSAAEPKLLAQILETKRKVIGDFIPELDGLRIAGATNPHVEVYVGVEGLKTIYEDMILEGKDIYHILNYAEYKKIFALYFIENFIAKRIEKNIWFRVVGDIDDQTLRMSDNQRLRETRILPSLAQLKPTLFVYGDKCGFMTFDETPVGVLITNPTIASSFRVLFDILWKQAK